MKASIVGIGWAEFEIIRLDRTGGTPYRQTINGTILQQTDSTVTVEYVNPITLSKEIVVLEK